MFRRRLLMMGRVALTWGSRRHQLGATLHCHEVAICVWVHHGGGHTCWCAEGSPAGALQSFSGCTHQVPEVGDARRAKTKATRIEADILRDVANDVDI